MHLNTSFRCLSPALSWLLALTFGWLGSAQAQLATGTIEGRVFNPSSGSYVERVHLTIDGSTLETFTDADGNYRFTSVPAGAVQIHAFRTGLPPSTTTVTVTAGAVVQHTIELAEYDAAPSTKSGEPSVVKLDTLV